MAGGEEDHMTVSSVTTWLCARCDGMRIMRAAKIVETAAWSMRRPLPSRCHCGGDSRSRPPSPRRCHFVAIDGGDSGSFRPFLTLRAATPNHARTRANHEGK